MTYPAAFSTSILDGQLGLPAQPLEIPLVVGVSSLGTNATVYYETNPNTVLTDLGYGPMPETAMRVVEQTGAVLCLKLQGSVAAVNSSVTATRVGTSTSTVTVSGAALRDYRAKVVITVTTAALGSGKFKYTLDNGNTYSEEITIPSGGTYTVPNSGLTLTFAVSASTFDAGDSHAFTSTCAHWNTTNLSSGLTALLASPLLIGKKIRKVYFTGIPDLAATAATNAAGVASFMSSLQAADHFARALMDCGSLDSTTNVLANYVAAFSDRRVAGCYGRCEMTSKQPIPGFGLPFVSIVQAVALRASQAEISENLGRVKSGPITGVKSTTLSQDEGLTPAFSADNKIITLRSHRNIPGGAYVTFGFLKSPVGSDFKAWDYGITIDSACTVIKAAADAWLLDKLRALTDGSGNLHPVDAAKVRQSIEGPVGSIMRGPTVSGLPSHVSAQQVIVETNYDFLSGGDIRITYKATPTVAVEGGTITLGLVRQIAEAA
jgi:hypothetical protein